MANRDRLRGQTAIVTGAGRGIGHGIATRLSAEGARVIAWDLAYAAETTDDEHAPLFRDVVDVTDAGYHWQRPGLRVMFVPC